MKSFTSTASLRWSTNLHLSRRQLIFLTVTRILNSSWVLLEIFLWLPKGSINFNKCASLTCASFLVRKCHLWWASWGEWLCRRQCQIALWWLPTKRTMTNAGHRTLKTVKWEICCCDSLLCFVQAEICSVYEGINVLRDSKENMRVRLSDKVLQVLLWRL